MSPTTVVIPFPNEPQPSTELEINRFNTTAYIASDPTDIQFIPRQRTSDGHGGWVWSKPDPMQAQRVRIITSAPLAGLERRTEDGRVVNPELMILLEWDAVVASGYRFVLDGATYEVVYVNDDLKYEKQAEVYRIV